MKAIIIFILTITTVQAQVKSWYQSAPASKYGQLTQQLIDQLKTTSPEIFHAMDTLDIPVYVKMMDDKTFQKGASGLTTIQKDCIFIRLTSCPRASKILAHEFGHAIYQINHPEYVNFYTQRYTDRDAGELLGHDGDDESGKMASLFEQKHINDIRNK